MRILLGLNSFAIFCILLFFAGFIFTFYATLSAGKNYINYKKGKDFEYAMFFNPAFEFFTLLILCIFCFWVFNGLVSDVFYSDAPYHKRACINGEIFRFDDESGRYYPDTLYKGNNYYPINSTALKITLGSKEYELVEACDNNIYCTSMIDDKTGWNIYEHTADILDGNIVKPVEKTKENKE